MNPRLTVPFLTTVVLSVCVAGCSRFHTEYGQTDGVQGTQSLNGFGGFRDSIQRGGNPSVEIKTRDLSRLSQRAKNYEAIVWVPQSWPPFNQTDAIEWFDEWLSQGNRTMVFVVPDGGSTEAYFKSVADLAPPDQRLEYRRRLAKRINDRLLEDGRRSDIAVADWFIASALPFRTILPERQIADFTLVPDPQSDDSQSGDDELLRIDDVELVEMDPDELLAEIETMIAEDDGNSDDGNSDDADRATQERQFEPVCQQSVLNYSQSETITTLARIRNSDWLNSQVLVVASGGLLTNFAMTGDAAIELAATIRSETMNVSAPTDGVMEFAFLHSGSSMIPISNVKPGQITSTGMELLTTWPLSLVVMHGLFLGVVMCLMLLPAFGRARRVTYNRTTHFGNHLSAMATLMRRSASRSGMKRDGVQTDDSVLFAKKKISQYLKVVRGETTGPWVLPDDPTETEQKNL